MLRDDVALSEQSALCEFVYILQGGRQYERLWNAIESA